MKVQLETELTREKIINIIIRQNSQVRFDTWMNCDCSIEELEKELANLDWNEFDELKKDCFNKQKELEQERKRLNKLPLHELLEKGEELGLWKQSEKQKRLI